jgi:hypothetical protein
MLPLVEEVGPAFLSLFEFRLEVEALIQSNFFYSEDLVSDMVPRLGKYSTQFGGPSLPFKDHATCIHYTFFLFILIPIYVQSDLRAPMLLCTRNSINTY